MAALAHRNGSSHSKGENTVLHDPQATPRDSVLVVPGGHLEHDCEPSEAANVVGLQLEHVLLWALEAVPGGQGRQRFGSCRDVTR